MKSKMYYDSQDISISFAHATPCAQTKPDSSHCHDKYEILYIISGTGRYVVEGTEYTVRPRTLMFMRPFEYHNLILDNDVEYSRYCIHFSQSILASEALHAFSSMATSDSASGNYYSAAALPSDIDTVFDRLDMLDTLPEDLKRAYIRALVTELIIILSVSSAEKRPSDEAELGARVIRYLNSNIDKDVSLDKLARRFFVSKYYLCRAFKKHNGISVHGYVNHKRVMYAKQLIESGETASGAAYKVGFGDYSAFYRAYVRIIGKAPTRDEEERNNV